MTTGRTASDVTLVAGCGSARERRDRGAHSVLVVADRALRDAGYAHVLGGDYFQRRAERARPTRRLVTQLERLKRHRRVTGAPAASA